MTLNEIEDFLIRISKDEKANSKLADAMSWVLMKQALFFNIVLMLIITGVFFIQDMSVWGGIVGLFIISSMLVYRIKKIKNEYLKDVKKITKKEKIHLFSDFLVDIYELLLRTTVDMAGFEKINKILKAPYSTFPFNKNDF